MLGKQDAWSDGNAKFIIPLMHVIWMLHFLFLFTLIIHSTQIGHLSPCRGELHSMTLWILSSVHKSLALGVMSTMREKGTHEVWDSHGDMSSIFFSFSLFISLVYVPLCLAATSSNKHSPNPLGCDKSCNACGLCYYSSPTILPNTVVFLVNTYLPIPQDRWTDAPIHKTKCRNID